jgi:hypothetical protein
VAKWLPGLLVWVSPSPSLDLSTREISVSLLRLPTNMADFDTRNSQRPSAQLTTDDPPVSVSAAVHFEAR